MFMFAMSSFYKGYWRNDHLESGERAGAVTMTKKGHHLLRTMTNKGCQFFMKNRVMPSVTVPGDTNFSDATEFLDI